MTKKPTVTTLQSGFNSTETLNANFEALRDSFDNTLSLDGSLPNAMEADLDLNGNNIIGAAGLLINGTDYLVDIEAAKAAALLAQAGAETAETNAETAESNAETSETAAGLSATAAASSETASELAKTAAELAETNAETSESNAAASATNAATSATTASTGASTASTKASEAATSATNAATSATESETAKTGAETARDAALAALDSFDDRYLGVKSSDPTVDNDGDALVVGALYFNSNTNLLYVYNGTTWQVTANAASGDLVSTNNLSDLTSAATARTNLGLGTAATTDSTVYATAAQGAKADTATQPTDLGTAATADANDFATAAQGTTADSAVQPNDSPTFAGLTVDTNTLFVDAANNRVGINTTNPSEALTVIGSSVVGDTTTSYNQLTINGGHVGDGDNDYGLTINSFEPAITLLDRSGGAGSGQIRVQSNGAFWFLRDSTNDGTIGHSSNTTDSVIAKLEADGTVTATSYSGDGSALTGIASGANDDIFWENGQTVTSNYTITNGKNAMSAGPITINSGVTVTVGAGETWTVV